MKRRSSLRAASPLALGKRAGGATVRFFTSPVKDTIGELGSAVRIERELHAVPIGRSNRELSKVYTYALYGVAILTVLAFFNNRAHFAGAFLLALILGAMYVVWIAHRDLFLTAGVVIWWAATAPFIALLTADELVTTLMTMKLASSTPLIWATGAGVWLAAIMMRVRRPWLMMLTTWVILFGAVFLTVRFWEPEYSYYVAWSLVLLYLAWRGGVLLTITDFMRGRGGLGRDYTEATEAQYEVYKHLNQLPRGFRIFRQLASPADKGTEMVDALVAGPTGLFYVAAVPADGEITVAAGRPRRILVKKKPIDRTLAQIAATARSIRKTLDLDLTTIVALSGATFPNRGLLAVKVRPGKVELVEDPAEVESADVEDVAAGKLAKLRALGAAPWRLLFKRGPRENRVFDAQAQAAPEPLTLLDPELLKQRIRFGPAVYTSGQLGRVVHRVRTRLTEIDRKESNQPAATDESDANGAVTARLALR